MTNEEQFFKAVGRTSLVAGPLFLLLLLLLEYQASMPDPLVIRSSDVTEIMGTIPVVIPLTVLVGACLAFPTCLILGGILFHLANLAPLVRPAVLWIAVGGGAAFALSWGLFDATNGSGAMAFTATAMACAALVRSHFHWD